MEKLNKKLWKQKGIWLLSLAVFFYLTYNAANYFTIWRAKTEIIPHIMFQWEHKIPLIPWTIIPYWTENLFYGLAILLAINSKQLKTLGKRLFATQIICVLGFLLFPLQQINVINRPEVQGFFGWWFDSLMKFDHPYNQAPSLHIALLVVLWTFYTERFSKKWHWLISIWSLFIGASVLTTWQHHFIDIPAGMLAGALAIWIFPNHIQSPLYVPKLAKNWKWFAVYFTVSIILIMIAIVNKSTWLWLLYPAFSLLIVACNYGFFGKKGFPKQKNGNYSLSQWILFLPYIFIAKINSKIWTRKNNPYDKVLPNLFLGSIPNAKNARQFKSLVDCCAEIPFNGHKAMNYYPNYLLDMTPLSLDECEHAANTINKAIRNGDTLVFCALGYSRSAASLVSYLVIYRNYSINQAIQQIKKARKDIVLNKEQIKILRRLTWKYPY
jgi:protein-tyrosine phosphatase